VLSYDFKPLVLEITEICDNNDVGVSDLLQHMSLPFHYCGQTG